MRIPIFMRLAAISIPSAAFLSGCATASELGRAAVKFVDELGKPPEHVLGKYTLTTWGGVAMPAALPTPSAGQCPVGQTAGAGHMRGGSLTLDSAGVARLRATAAVTCVERSGSVSVREVPQDMDAPYIWAPADGGIRIMPPGGEHLVLTFDSAAATFLWSDLGARFERGADLESPPPGRYTVVEVDGRSPPVSLAPQNGCRRHLTGGALHLKEDGGFTLDTEIHRACPNQSDATAYTYEGRYRLIPGGVSFEPRPPLRPFVATFRDESLTLPLGSLLLKLRTGVRTAEASDPFPMEIPAYIAAARKQDLSQCSHPDLENLASVAAADTAGLQQLIDDAFPGWRLATERELGCRAANYGWTPTGFYSDWGTGKAWWVMRDDFDGDDKVDTAIIISKSEGPSDLQLVVIDAHRRGHLVFELSNALIVDVTEAGDTVSGCRYDSATGSLDRDSIVIPHAGLSVSNASNWGEVFIWQAGKFRSLEEATGLGACH